MYRFHALHQYINGFLFIILFLSSKGYTQETNPIKLSIVTESLPPLQYIDEKGNVSGAMVELIHAVVENAGFIGEAQIYPWARAYHMAKNRPNTLIFSIMKAPARLEQFNWIGMIYHADVYLVKLKNSYHPQLANVEEALKYRVGVVRLDVSQDYLVNHGFVLNENMLTSSGYAGLWQLLYKNNVDFLLANKFMWQLENSHPSVNNQPIEVALELKDFATNYYLATSKGTSPEINKKLTKSLEMLKKSGQYQSILAKWQLD